MWGGVRAGRGAVHPTRRPTRPAASPPARVGRLAAREAGRREGHRTSAFFWLRPENKAAFPFPKAVAKQKAQGIRFFGAAGRGAVRPESTRTGQKWLPSRDHPRPLQLRSRLTTASHTPAPCHSAQSMPRANSDREYVDTRSPEEGDLRARSDKAE
jgi:hypothetical protein